MSSERRKSGTFRSGLPYTRIGHGPRTLVVFVGLEYENKAPGGMTARYMSTWFRTLLDEYTIYLSTRRPGMAPGTTLGDMADDYAATIGQEFGGPVDVMGTSTGGSIALQFGADHSELIRRLVIHSAAYRLGPAGRWAQKNAAEMAAQGRWGAVTRLMMGWVMPRRGFKRAFFRPLSCLAGAVGPLTAPKDASDFIVTVEAEDAFDLKDRLGEIAAPTLVIAGADDPGYSPALFRETAEGIPDGRLVLYEGMGHPASGKRFTADLAAFLLDDAPADDSARGVRELTRLLHESDDFRTALIPLRDGISVSVYGT